MENQTQKSLFFKPKLNQSIPEQKMENKMIDKVFSTMNYEIFSSLDGNRIVNPLHVKKIADSMKIKVLFIPIIVNEEFQVIDGQHRLEARKQLGLDIPYIICPNYTLEDVHRANSNHKAWTNVDFLNAYAEAGVENYVFLKKLHDQYSDKISVSDLLALNCISRFNAMKYFKSGESKISDQSKCIDITKKWYIFYSTITKNKKPFSHHSSFIEVFRKIIDIEDFDFKRLIEKCEKYSDLLESQNSLGQYLFMLDKVYNYRSQSILRLK